MAERIVHSLGILLAGLFESELSCGASEADRISTVPSEPPPPPELARRTESGVHRILP
jgi:hypothetical protein